MPVPAAAKPWWQSKLVWLGAIEAARGVLAYFNPDFTLSGDDADILVGFAVIVLRFVTRGPVVIA